MKVSDASHVQTVSVGHALRVSDSQRRLALGVAMFLIVWCAVLTPFANNPWSAVPGYMTAFGAAMFVTNILLAALLFNRGMAERSKPTLTLGTAYLFVALIFVPLMLVFPGAFVPGNVMGEPVSAVWIWSFWHAGFALLILRYAMHTRSARSRVQDPAPWREAGAVLGVVVALASVGTLGLPWLPQLFVNGKTFFEGPMQAIAWSVLGVNLAALLSVVRIRDKTSEQLWLAVGMIAACFDVWLTFHGSNRFSMGWYIAKMGSLFTSMVVLMSLFVDLTSLYRRAFQANALLAKMASHDVLTGLANRRNFDDMLETEWRRALREQRSLALLMLDVDYFKLYNDHYGHLGGDECLRRVAATIQSVVSRPGDLAARYGGEEFAVVLPHTDAAGAEKLATRIRDEIAALGLAHAKSALQHVTVSIGVAALCPRKDQNERTLIALADKGLYQAKGQGRNRVFVVAVPAAAAASGAGSNASSMGLGGGGLSALPV